MWMTQILQSSVIETGDGRLYINNTLNMLLNTANDNLEAVDGSTEEYAGAELD